LDATTSHVRPAGQLVSFTHVTLQKPSDAHWAVVSSNPMGEQSAPVTQLRPREVENHAEQLTPVAGTQVSAEQAVPWPHPAAHGMRQTTSGTAGRRSTQLPRPQLPAIAGSHGAHCTGAASTQVPRPMSQICGVH
jgi:hypothetical protein